MDTDTLREETPQSKNKMMEGLDCIDIPFLLLPSEVQSSRCLPYPVAIRLLRAKNELSKNQFSSALSVIVEHHSRVKVKTIKLWENGIATPRIKIRTAVDKLVADSAFTIDWEKPDRNELSKIIRQIGYKHLDIELFKTLVEKLNTLEPRQVSKSLRLIPTDTTKWIEQYKSWRLVKVVGGNDESGKTLLQMFGLDVIIFLEKWLPLYVRRTLPSVLEINPQLLRKWRCQFCYPGQQKRNEMTKLVTEAFASLVKEDVVVRINWHSYPSDLGSKCTASSNRSPFFLTAKRLW
jgi:hypothetical protein